MNLLKRDARKRGLSDEEIDLLIEDHINEINPTSRDTKRVIYLKEKLDEYFGQIKDSIEIGFGRDFKHTFLCLVMVALSILYVLAIEATLSLLWILRLIISTFRCLQTLQGFLFPAKTNSLFHHINVTPCNITLVFM